MERSNGKNFDVKRAPKVRTYWEKQTGFEEREVRNLSYEAILYRENESSNRQHDVLEEVQKMKRS